MSKANDSSDDELFLHRPIDIWTHLDDDDVEVMSVIGVKVGLITTTT